MFPFNEAQDKLPGGNIVQLPLLIILAISLIVATPAGIRREYRTLSKNIAEPAGNTDGTVLRQELRIQKDREWTDPDDRPNLSTAEGDRKFGPENITKFDYWSSTSEHLRWISRPIRPMKSFRGFRYLEGMPD